MRFVIFAFVIASAIPCHAQQLIDHLRDKTPPTFADNHTLPPLTRWGWFMPFEVRKELADHWGYGVEFGGYVKDKLIDRAIKNPEDDNAKAIALTVSDPDRYPLFGLMFRPLLAENREKIPEALVDTQYLHDADGNRIADKRTGKHSWKTISPETPDAVYEYAAAESVRMLKRLDELAPLSIILNGGEYGITPHGHSGRNWEKDPSVVAARGDRSWYDYVSERKGRLEGIIADAVREAFPKRELYIFYHFGGEPTWNKWQWSMDYKYTQTITDLPSQSLYYRHFNTGWDGKQDLLTNFLASVTQAVKQYDHPLSYNWVSGGWKPDRFSEPDRYMGFLKCCYTAGQIGAVASYFSQPEGFRNVDVGPELPKHLQQMMTLGRVHALFSHHEKFLREGDLLPGPDLHTNPNAEGLPAMEFPTEPGVRVLVRKLRDADEYLLTAWAANGPSRSVEVDLPEVGTVDVLARPGGSVYRVTASQEVDFEPPVVDVELVDESEMTPTAGFGS